MANIEIFGTLVRNDQGTNRDKIVDGIQVEGGFFLCASIPTNGTWGEGQLCYCTNDSRFYQYDGNSWGPPKFVADVGQNKSYSIQAVSALPAVRDDNTIYFIYGDET